MSAPRHSDWPRRLGDFVQGRQAQPFTWGPNDCASFAADAVQALTGVDMLAELRGHRLTERQALRRARAIGGIPLAIVRAGLAPVAPAQARSGDLVLLAQGAQRVLAVCVGADAVAPGVDGLAVADMGRAVMAWRV